MQKSRPESWLYPTERGLYCEPGQFHIDPHLPVDRAVITHGHDELGKVPQCGGRVVGANPAMTLFPLRHGRP